MKLNVWVVYIFIRAGHRSETSQDADVDVSFWVTQKAFDQGMYPVLYKTLDDWLKSNWPFKKIVYTNEELPING
jgi:hypothetical protein